MITLEITNVGLELQFHGYTVYRKIELGEIQLTIARQLTTFSITLSSSLESFFLSITFSRRYKYGPLFNSILFNELVMMLLLTKIKIA